MVFFDTCIWIELCSVKSPETKKEKRQSVLASALLSKVIDEKETIVTCEEQLCEIVSAVSKVKMKEASRKAKERGEAGIGNIKEFRQREEFASTQELCKSVICDVKHFADIHKCSYTIDDILERIDLADINDCIYYDYCKNEKIDFYTFDKDIINLGANGRVHVIA